MRQKIYQRTIIAAYIVISLLSLAIVGLWARSYITSDMIFWSRPGRMGQVWTSAGALHAQLMHKQNAPASGALQWRYNRGEASRNLHLPWWRRWLIHWRAGPTDDPVRGDWDRVATVPLWCLLLAFGVIPGAALFWGRRRLIARWQRQRLCPACGYDLRASVASCPECGYAFAADQPAQLTGDAGDGK